MITTMQRNQPTRCVVCDAALPRRFEPAPRAPDPFPACHAVACRMVVSRRAEMGDTGLRHYLAMHVRHRLYLAQQERARVARSVTEVRENTGGWDALRARLPAALAPEPLRLLLPTGPRRAYRLPAIRRARYRAHLLSIIVEARGLDSPQAVGVASAPADASSMAGRLCGFCGGGCCTKGGDEAYLNAATIRRFIDAQPGLSNEAVLDAYLARVPAAAQARSCINHTRAGCSLPREMRSDVCNRYACEALARLQAAQRGPDGVQVVLLVRRKQDHWRRAEPDLDNAVNAHAVLRETGVRRLAPRTPAPA